MHYGLRNFLNFNPDVKTWKDLASFGQARMLQLMRNVGKGSMQELRDLLEQKGCPMLP